VAFPATLLAAILAIAALALPASGSADETTLKPGACANLQVGEDLPDSLVGTQMGDRLSSLGGADDLRGRAGHDCLFGAAGSDLLVGGSGGDYLAAGSGADRVDARDGQRDNIACGSGWDVVVADRTDVIHGCETVKLPPPDTAELQTR
jgi:Ca2+-binding RTX toxin-like protein